MDHLFVVLVHTRFPENIGMAARACANMGCHELRLVKPEKWILEKAQPLATPKGLDILDHIKIFPNLADALADANKVYGTTARLGGWRRSYLTPWKAAKEIAKNMNDSLKTALVFGPEDRGLSNEDIAQCQYLVHIPTSTDASSLNLAQAVLLVLYECARAAHNDEEGKEGNEPAVICMEEQRRLEREFKEILLGLDCLHGANPDYFFMQWRNIFARAALRRHEYDALMGFCRQIRNMLKTNL